MAQFRKERQGELPDDYPEYGFFPECPFIPADQAVLAKNQEIEVLHGRWAMLGVAGAWAQEAAGRGPWFSAGALCTPSNCSGISFPGPGGAEYNLAPGSSAFPNFWLVLGINVFAVGLAEAYRSGAIAPAFPELPSANAYPGGRFDPLGFVSPRGTRASSSADPFLELSKLKTQELKHARLAMIAWLGILVQSLVTNIDSIRETGQAINGPLANLQYHLEAPYGHTVFGVLGEAYKNLQAGSAA